MKKKFINKRKKNILNINFKSFLFFSLFFFFIFIFLNYEKLKNISIILVEKYSDEYNFNLNNIEISELNYLDEKEIFKFFDPYKDKSIFLIPIKQIANNILQIKWVNSLDIKINYKDTIKIDLQEEIPIGIYDNGNQKILFSNNLVFLEILQKKNNYFDLITFYGENAVINSKKLIKNFEDSFLDNIKSAIFIENRRWNILLNNLILLKLPAENLKEAIKNYKKIYASFSNKDLKDMESIDLRIKNQAIIKYHNR